MNKINLTTIKATLKTGEEQLTLNNKSIGYNLIDFWRWSVSDILSNATRGKFAEFIVGTAINLDINNLRDEWDAYDLITNEGVKIEIKSSAYIQSWNQTKFSNITFSIKPAKFWNADDNMSKDEAKRHADIYVFCLLKHKEQETINPLYLEQWEFYVLPTYKLDNYNRSQCSITLNSLQKMTNSVDYDTLGKEIKMVSKQQNENKNLF